MRERRAVTGAILIATGTGFLFLAAFFFVVSFGTMFDRSQVSQISGGLMFVAGTAGFGFLITGIVHTLKGAVTRRDADL